MTLNSGHSKKISTGVNGSEVGPFDNFPMRLFNRQMQESLFCNVTYDSLTSALSYDPLYYPFSIKSALRQVKTFMN